MNAITTIDIIISRKKKHNKNRVYYITPDGLVYLLYSERIKVPIYLVHRSWKFRNKQQKVKPSYYFTSVLVDIFFFE